jgi:hypothetical protein
LPIRLPRRFGRRASNAIETLALAPNVLVAALQAVNFAEACGASAVTTTREVCMVFERVIRSCLIITAAAFVFAPIAARAASWPDVFSPVVVRDVQLQMDPADWETIRFDLTNEIEVPAWLAADGEVPILVSVRRKSSRALPSEADPRKIGLKIDINEYVSGQLWNGLAKLSLENGGDVPVVYEGMAWQLHELASQAGFYGPEQHAALANWVTVSVNGEALGVYTSVEQRDSQFLRNRGIRVKGSTWLYEVDDIDMWALEDGDPHSPTFQTLCYPPFAPAPKRGPSQCATPPDGVLESALDSLIEMDAMLAEGAVDAFTANPDALFTHGKNFKFADFAHSGLKRRYYPWDLDAVFRSTATSIYGDAGRRSVTQTPYERILLNHPGLRARYNAILLALVADGGPLSETTLDALLDAVEAALAPALLADPYAGPDAVAAFDSLRGWVPARIADVRAQVAVNGPPPPR